MDILRAEIARKRKLLEEKQLLNSNKKYFKRGELLAKEKEEYFQKFGEREEQAETTSSGSCVTSTDVTSEHSILPRPEVIRRLRERCEPILLFGETENEAFRRLRQCEITEPEINRGFRNDFQEAMEQVDQAYLDEILTSHGAESSSSREKTSAEDFSEDDSVTWEAIQEMAKRLGRGNKDHDMNVITSLLQYVLKLWNNNLNECSPAERMSTKMKIARATFTQTRVYMKPLFRKLKNKTLPEDILDSLTDIARALLERNYIAASDAYLQMAIGNAPWPIGVTMVGIHARTGREKIFSKNVAHVLNDETQRKYIQGLKRLMTKCQEFFPTNPSRCVEYVSKKDQVE
ncbi:pre-mRNA-splicing factor 18 [Phlebotomus argentipes]|uniref:pre-mRNA-splicing factor 18 n=1 Tax=Phlebotomus argentipes TaxID=94469 RepID=UPI0028937372|nr:pre-mRNA-splicing factor 18 [Phlebotomus argentipes]